MKTLRNMVRGGADEKDKRSRKMSLPAQNYKPEQHTNGRERKQSSVWQNMKRKISFTVSQEEPQPEKTEESRPIRPKFASESNCVANGTSRKDTDSPRVRRVNSDVAEEDVMNFAIIECNVELLKSILNGSRANVNYLRPPGIAPLHQACMSGSLEIVELLVRSGASIHLRDYKELTPLQLANCYGHFEIAEYLLRMGSPVVDIKDGFQIEKKNRKKSWIFRLGHRSASYEPGQKQ
eukprot:Seg1348.14 transcript_id=Seg1348.14/GoldUCD/mRNA.D3Y31 product="Protein phosphatase 1 regulatory subunit 27" protein_id=Seg1348.14/GoldUCD/D3Y31